MGYRETYNCAVLYHQFWYISPCLLHSSLHFPSSTFRLGFSFPCILPPLLVRSSIPFESIYYTGQYHSYLLQGSIFLPLGLALQRYLPRPVVLSFLDVFSPSVGGGFALRLAQLSLLSSPYLFSFSSRSPNCLPS